MRLDTPAVIVPGPASAAGPVIATAMLSGTSSPAGSAPVSGAFSPFELVAGDDVRQFAGSFEDVVAAVKQLNVAQGKGHPVVIGDETTPVAGSYVGGDEIPYNDVRALYRTSIGYSARPVALKGAEVPAMFELDPSRGTGDPITRWMTLTSVDPEIVAFVDQETVVPVDPTTHTATITNSGNAYVMATWQPAPRAS